MEKHLYLFVGRNKKVKKKNRVFAPLSVFCQNAGWCGKSLFKL